ncbi:unnamed protein product [Ectocarpus sp. 8 AP-2014]
MSQERLGEQACIRCKHARLRLVHTLGVIIAVVSRNPFSRTLFLQIIFPFPPCFLFELVGWVDFDSGSTSIQNKMQLMLQPRFTCVSLFVRMDGATKDTITRGSLSRQIRF